MPADTTKLLACAAAGVCELAGPQGALVRDCSRPSAAAVRLRPPADAAHRPWLSPELGEPGLISHRDAAAGNTVARGVLEDRVRPAQLGVLPPQLRQLGPLAGRQLLRPITAIGLGLAHMLA